MKTRIDATILAVGCTTALLLVVAWQQTHPAPEPTVTLEDSGTPCAGTPIAVAYPYRGNPENPWECRVQCDGTEQRYILYSNGLATQCDQPPSCLDRGEDDGVTCAPPTVTPAS